MLVPVLDGARQRRSMRESRVVCKETSEFQIGIDTGFHFSKQLEDEPVAKDHG